MGIQRSTFLLAGGKATGAIVTFVGIALFTRQLGSSGIGTFFLFQSVLTLVVFASNLSIQSAAEKRISEGKPRGEVISSALILRAVALIATVVAILLLRSQITNYLGADLALYLIAGVVLSNLSEFVMRIMSGDLRIAETAILRLSQRIVWLVGGLVLIWYGYGIMGPIIALLLGLFVMASWSLLRGNLEFSRPSVQRMRELVAFMKYDLIAGASRNVYNWADVLIIGYFLTPAAVGNYEIAWRVTVIAGLLSDSISQVVFPQISHWVSQDAIDKIRDGLTEALAMSIALVIPALAGAVILAESILSVIFDISSQEASVSLVILMISRLVFVNFQPMKRILDGLDRVNLSARATLSSAIANVAFNVVLVQQFGIVGAAIGTTVAVIIGTIVVVYYLRAYLQIDYPTRMAGGFVLASIVMSGVLFGVLSRIRVDTIPSLFGIVLVGALVYFGILSLLPPTRQFLNSQYESFFVS